MGNELDNHGSDSLWGDSLRDAFPETDEIPSELVALMLRLSDEDFTPDTGANAQAGG